MRGRRKQTPTYKLQRGVLEETHPASTLVSDVYSLQNCEKMHFCCKRHTPMAFCYAVPANEYTYFSTSTRNTIATVTINTTIITTFAITAVTPPCPNTTSLSNSAMFMVHLTPHDQQISKLSFGTSRAATRQQKGFRPKYSLTPKPMTSTYVLYFLSFSGKSFLRYTKCLDQKSRTSWATVQGSHLYVF